MGLLERVATFVMATPLYPYELEFARIVRGQQRLIQHARGIVINIGCGNNAIATQVVGLPQVTAYFGLDYPWPPFEMHRNHGEKLCGSVLANVFIGRVEQIVDLWGDGNELPFSDCSIDTIILFEVLEHIASPQVFLSEISRVLRPGGTLLLSVPFIYPLHGGTVGEFDFFRYTESGLRALLSSCGMISREFYCVGGLGTTLSALGAHFLIRKCEEGQSQFGILVRESLSVPLFFLLNTFGRVLDAMGHHSVFTNRYFSVSEKQSQ